MQQQSQPDEKKKKVVEENLPQEEIQHLEAGVNLKEIQTDLSFINSLQ